MEIEKLWDKLTKERGLDKVFKYMFIGYHALDIHYKTK